jgi:hypothetical protein
LCPALFEWLAGEAAGVAAGQQPAEDGFLGAGGRPASAATIGVLAMALAGREAAK